MWYGFFSTQLTDVLCQTFVNIASDWTRRMSNRLLTNAAWMLVIVAGTVGAAASEIQDLPAGAAKATGSALKDAADQPGSDTATEFDQDAGRRPIAERNPRVIFITQKGCDRCQRELVRLRRPGGDFNPKRDVLVSHLRSPSHAHGIAANWKVETWSYEELRSLHDDLHERELANNPQFYSSGSQSTGSSGTQFGAGRKALGR